MKKTLVIVLACICALTLSIVALAEGLSDGETEAVAETTESVAETPEVPSAPEQAESEEEFVVYEDEEVQYELTEEDLAFIYCLNHFENHWVDEDPYHYVLEYENFGDKDGSVTLLVFYSYDSYNEDGIYEGREWESLGVELITILLPAGQKTTYAFEPGYRYNCMGTSIVGASYGDVSVEYAYMEKTMVNNQTIDEHLKGCTHSELVVKTA